MSLSNFEQIFANIVDGNTSHEQAKQELLAMNESGYSSAMFAAAIKVLKDRMHHISHNLDAIDVCGTGGDKLGTLNVSTAVCFVLAACGVTVAKHGNKAISSKSGSADIFQELNIAVTDQQEDIVASLEQHNLCFLFAPFFHTSLKNIAKLRIEIAQQYNTPTIFNYLGPLLNPANTKRQLIGVSRLDVMEPMAAALASNKEVSAYIVHGFDGMDEITICDNSYLVKVENGKVFDQEIINPSDYGFNKAKISDILGQDASYNAQELLSLFAGKKSSYRDIVIINASFALQLCGRAESIAEAKDIASAAIDQGKALDVLRNMQVPATS